MMAKRLGFDWNAVTIKAVRTQMHLTQHQMSEQLGISLQTLREWERGESRPTGPDRVQLNLTAKRAGLPYETEGTPIDVLGLSTRAYNFLTRAGYLTVEQVAALSDQEILAIRHLGQRTLADIRCKLESYLPSYPLLSKQSEARHRAVGDGKPLEILHLSNRAQNCLLRAGYRTIEQIAALNDEEFLGIRNLGWKSLAEINDKLAAYLREHPIPSDSVEPCEEPRPLPVLRQERRKLLAPPPLAPPGVLEIVRERNIPLDEISVERLELPTPSWNMLKREGIGTIGALALQPEHKWAGSPAIRERLTRYLNWIVDQGMTLWAEEARGGAISPFLRMTLAETSLERLVENWIADLPSRQQRVITWRYGLRGEPLTLKEIGEQHLGITRERVRQIQEKAKRRLSNHLRRQRIQPFVDLLKHVLRDAGGLMTEAQIEAALMRELAIGDCSPAGVVRLAGAVFKDFKWLRNAEAWGLSEYPLDEVDGVQKRLERVLEKEYVPLSVSGVIERFRTSHFYRSRRDRLDDHFVEACLRVHPGVLIDEDDLCSLKKWETRSTDEIILALREIGEPAHYSDIAEIANRLLGPEMRTSLHNIHAILGRRTDLFVRVGHGIYGLKAWGLPDDGSVANAAYRVLSEAGKPLHIDTITDGVLETWQVRRTSVYMAVKNDPRFLHIGPGMYVLRDRLSGQAEHETAADFGDLFGERLGRWQADLDDQQSGADLDTHAEVDAIRDIGLDFFSH